MPRVLKDVFIQAQSKLAPNRYQLLTTNVNYGMGLGAEQSLSVYFENNPPFDKNYKIITHLSQAGANQCPGIGNNPNSGSPWGLETDLCLRSPYTSHTCMKQEPIGTATNYISDVLYMRGKDCPAGWLEGTDYSRGCVVAAFGDDKKHKLCYKKSGPFNFFENYMCNNTANYGHPDCIKYFKDHPTFGDQQMNAYCKGMTIESDLCKNYYKDRSTAIYRDNLKDFCTDDNGIRFGAPHGICREKAKDGTGNLDEGVALYCREHPTDRYCSCSVAYLQTLKPETMSDEDYDYFLTNPLCYVKECGDTGHQFKRIIELKKNSGCPPLQICSQTFKNITTSDIKRIKCVQEQNIGTGPIGDSDIINITKAPDIISADYIPREKKKGEFIPLPEFIRQFLEPYQPYLSDSALTGIAGLILIIILYLFGIFDTETKFRFTPSPIDTTSKIGFGESSPYIESLFD
jgi:hypothetical protein